MCLNSTGSPVQGCSLVGASVTRRQLSFLHMTFKSRPGLPRAGLLLLSIGLFFMPESLGFQLHPTTRARAGTFCRTIRHADAQQTDAAIAAGVANSGWRPPPNIKEKLELTEGDVVEYALTNGQRGLGVITGTGQVHPLCKRSMDSVAFYYDEHVDSLRESPESIVVRVLNAWFEQRIVENRKINPHGEEAEEVFFLNEPLPPGCVPPLRED